MPGVKKPVVHAQFFGETRAMVNGKVVKDTAVNTVYDGKILHMDTRENNTLAHYDMNDKQLKTLLQRPTSKINLLDRLRQYGHRHTHKRHNKRTHKSKKTNKKKRRY